ncbi:MAG: hypothetical protein GX642_01225 [Smithella sp.]|nr:hypothetical protein [Smithella sp.]
MINNLNIEIWGRNYDLRVEYDCYDNETVTDAQLRAVEGLSAHPELISVSKEQVEDFCREQVQQDFENNKKDNVFSYIKPEYLFVKHEKNPRVAIMCKYKYDIEHGIAIVFFSDGKIDVGTQDIIL